MKVPSTPALALLLLLVVPSCSLFDDEDATRVLVVGDSVTRLSEEEITDELHWATTVDLRAHDGFRTDELLVTTQDGISADPDIAIVMPGYNDLIQEDVETEGLDDMVELVSQVPCTVWLLVPEEGAGYLTELAQRWNERVREMVADHDSIHVSDAWQIRVEGSPELTYLSEVDAVHPNDRGQQAIAEAMATSADRECR